MVCFMIFTAPKTEYGRRGGKRASFRQTSLPILPPQSLRKAEEAVNRKKLVQALLSLSRESSSAEWHRRRRRFRIGEPQARRPRTSACSHLRRGGARARIVPARSSLINQKEAPFARSLLDLLYSASSAMTSTSTRAPAGMSAAATQERAGLEVKYSA